MRRDAIRRAGVAVLLAAALILPAAAPGYPAQRGDIARLREDIRQLRLGQERLERELAECKAMLSRLSGARPAPPGPQPAPPPATAQVSLGQAILLGDTNAPLVLVEFCDLQCPYCARYHREGFPRLKSDYIDTGKLLYALIDYPLPFHRQAFKAAESLRCAGTPERGLQLMVTLATTADLAPERLVEAAGSLGLDPAQFRRCLEGGAHAPEIDRNIAAAKAAGVTGTPTFILARNPGRGQPVRGSVMRGAPPYIQLQASIEALLGGR